MIEDQYIKRHYTHDCNNCKPLGKFQEYELYFCDQGGNLPTVIARYGNEIWEYKSGLAFATGGPLLEAKNRAIAQGLL